MTGVRAYPSLDVGWQRLAEFLGERFDPALTSYEACCSFVEAEFADLGAEFYQRSVGYLYELTHFHFSGFKDSFFDTVIAAAGELDVVDVADVGGGVGLDAQALASHGLDVTMYDFASPGAEYAAWRLRRDGQNGVRVRTMDELGASQHGLVYAVDTLEHVAEPGPFVRRLFECGSYVCVNLFEHDPSDWDGEDMHFPLNHRTLLREFGRHGELMQVGVSGATVITLWKTRRG